MLHKVALCVWLFHILLCEASGNYPDQLSVPSTSADSRFFLTRPHRESQRYKPGPTRKHPPPIVTKQTRRPPPPPPYRHPKPVAPAPAPYRHPKPVTPAPYRHPKPVTPAPYRRPKPVAPHRQRPSASGYSPPHQAPIYNEEPRPYSFGYKVTDHYEGIEHGHQEESNGKIVIGTYNVDLPDGRRQTVDYQADKTNGYLANVQYEGEAQYPEPEYYGPAITFKPHGYEPEYTSQDVAQDIYQPSYYLPSVHQESDGGYYKRSTPPPPLDLQRYEYKQQQPDPSPDIYDEQASYGTYQPYPPIAQQPPIHNQYGEPEPQPYFQPPPPPSQAHQDPYAPAPYAVADPELQQYLQQQQEYLQQERQYSQNQPKYIRSEPEPEPEPAYQPLPYDYGW